MDNETRDRIRRLNQRIEELEEKVEELEGFKESIIAILWSLNTAVTPLVEFELSE